MNNQRSPMLERDQGSLNAISEFEKHDQQSHQNHPKGTDSNSLLLNEYSGADDSYEAFFHDAFTAFNAEMETYYNNLGKMEQKETSVQNEIVTKMEEMRKLSRILRSKRDNAMQAIGQLTTFEFKPDDGIQN